MEPDSRTKQGPAGFSTHVQQQLVHASARVRTSTNSAAVHLQSHHPRNINTGPSLPQHPHVSHSQPPLPQPQSLPSPQPSQTHPPPQLPQLPQPFHQHRGRPSGRLFHSHHPATPLSHGPALSGPETSPPLGTAPHRPRHHLPSGPRSSVSQSTAMSADTAQAFFLERARGGAYRGNSFARGHSQNRQHVTTSAPPSQTSNQFARPSPRNRQLYQVSDASHGYGRQSLVPPRTELHQQFLLATASEALREALSPQEGREKENFRLELEMILRSAIASCPSWTPELNLEKVNLKCYGSLANGFAVKGSDMDLLLMLPQTGDDSGDLLAEAQRVFERALLDQGYGARLLTNTRVPILRVCQRPDETLLDNLRNYRQKWEEEESDERVGTEKLDSNRLPVVSNEEMEAASHALATLDITPKDIPLPPSPARENASLEYKGDVGIQCDVNFSNYVAIHNTQLLRCYCKCDPRVREMVLFVKAWVKARKINTPYHGTLSSYGYTLMTLHYLMNIVKPPLIPNLQEKARDADAWAGKKDIELFEGFDIRFYHDEANIERDARTGHMTDNKESLGSLLHGFFWYYSVMQGFHWSNETISIRTLGGILTKKSKGWTEAKWTGDNNQIRQRYLLAIEDPFETEHNIARTVGHSGVVAIRDEFRRAWTIIMNIQFVGGKGWQWRRQDGTVGEDLLANHDDRGDLLRKDQEFHRRKHQELRAKAASLKSPETGGVTGVDANQDKGNVSEKNETENGTCSDSVPKILPKTRPRPFDRPNGKLIKGSPNSQSPPRQTRYKLKVESDDSDDEVPARKGQRSCSLLVNETTTLDGKVAHAKRECMGAGETEYSEGATDSKQDSQEFDRKESREAFVISGEYEPYEVDGAKVKHDDMFYANTVSRLTVDHVCQKPQHGEENLPRRWNLETQAGRWLLWRDNKIRDRHWIPARNSNPEDPLVRLDQKFPFDAARPIQSLKAHRWMMRAAARQRLTSPHTPPPFHYDYGELPPARDCKDTSVNSNQDRVVEQSRKDSAASGLPAATVTQPGTGTAESTLPTTQPQESTNKAVHDEAPELSNPNTDAETASADELYDMALPPRDQDPKIIPVPQTPAFQFDPRQLRDLDIIQRGGNGCARRGEEWNVEIDGEWGGGGVMGMLKSSSGVVTSVSVDGAADTGYVAWPTGQGGDEALLAELPGAKDMDF